MSPMEVSKEIYDEAFAIICHAESQLVTLQCFDPEKEYGPVNVNAKDIRGWLPTDYSQWKCRQEEMDILTRLLIAMKQQGASILEFERAVKQYFVVHAVCDWTKSRKELDIQSLVDKYLNAPLNAF